MAITNNYGTLSHRRLTVDVRYMKKEKYNVVETRTLTATWWHTFHLIGLMLRG